MPDLGKTLDGKIARSMRRDSLKPAERGGWRFLSFFGAVGFGVAVPVAACTYIGVRAERPLPFIIAGAIAGVFNAWHFVRGELKK
ncbi:MAG: hypothetical protein LBH41_00575 [Rickettsiales bacterium]|jgi:phosphatidylserine synthase|nr:hypothetical protein [Rickettsiales bacterium]